MSATSSEVAAPAERRPFRVVGDGVTVEVRLTPRADRDRIDGRAVLSDGSVVLALRVRAVPDAGRANAAAEALIAEGLGVARRSVVLCSGATQRRKTFRVVGDPRALAARLDALLGE